MSGGRGAGVLKKTFQNLDLAINDPSYTGNGYDPLNDFDPTSRNDYMNFITTSANEIIGNRYICFNADGLRNDARSIEYEKIFQRNT